ncbi:hypothetical protein GTP46_05135 [Duganella sp. FT135W]|uniref:YCII-related domain-containing protein n=1 Tax=Duganella flavida TaxID=2692175 RepID=A0A6L8K661_9BURK|nr:YciI family protein [Duganella flavida]MYM22027.1 hypothetical protein [Duganella flavida]
MNEYILLMHDDVLDPAIANDDARWNDYLSQLRASGQFDGGSSIGAGAAFKKHHADPPGLTAINGYIRIRAESIDAARRLLNGNPNYEAGGTVEIRELPHQ